MKEYRVRASFTEVYSTRVYKNKRTMDKEEALQLLKDATEYYSYLPYIRYSPRVVLEEREVSEWTEVEQI